VPSWPGAGEVLDRIATLYWINNLFEHNRSIPADGASHVNGGYLTDTALNLPDWNRPNLIGAVIES
jgi:hypothetical protein